MSDVMTMGEVVRAPLLRISPIQGGPVEVLAEGTIITGCLLNVPQPKQLRRVTLKDLSFVQIGDLLVISPRRGLRHEV